VVGRLEGKQFLLHGHCHHKAVFGGPASELALLRKAGAHAELIQSTCCGMAGPFGFEKDKFDVSKAIANLDLLPAIAGAEPGTVIVTDGFSCREQISHLAHRPSMHFAEALAATSRPASN
jgi:Fe-S oxidoreductase